VQSECGDSKRNSRKRVVLSMQEERHEQLYLFMKKHHEEFMADAKLRQLFHLYNTNSVEGINKFLTEFFPKDRTYRQTIENQARVYLAVGLQSIGYRQVYKRTFELKGIKLMEDDMTSLFLRSEDIMQLWRQEN
jgi:hypothetical protein